MKREASNEELKKLLDSYSSNALMAMVNHQHAAPKGSKSKAALINTLTRILPEREQVLATLKDLSKAERAALDVILQREGKTGVYVIRKELQRQKLIDDTRSSEFNPYTRTQPDPRRRESRRLEDILARLTLRGLVFSAEDPYDPRRGVPAYAATKRDIGLPLKTVFIPQAIRQHLPTPPPLPNVPSMQASDIRTVTQSSARAFQRDLYLYWSYVRDHKVSTTAKGELHKKALTQVNDALLQHDLLEKGDSELQHPRLRFIRGLLTALDLLWASEARELDVLPATNFFALAPGDRVQRCYASWRDGNFYNDLLSLSHELLPVQTSLPLIPAHTTIVTARRSVLEHIRKLAVTDWIALDQLCERIRETDPEFLFERGAPRPYYYYAPDHPYRGDNALGAIFRDVRDDDDGWDKVETNFIRGLVNGPLFWMGLIDLGGSTEAKPKAFRLTELGAWLLGLGPRPQLQVEGGRVIVQPNLHIVALDPVNESTLAALDRFAERLSAERAVEYQLTRASVYAAQQADWDVTRIKSFLKETTGADVPANVARTLDEWQIQHERIIIRPHVALAHGLPAAIDDLFSDQASAQHIAARPAPQVALLHNPTVLKSLLQSLHTRGTLPLLTTRAEIKSNSIVASENGRIQFTTRAPSLYLHGHLAAIADPDDEGGYVITSETVARAARSGMSAPEIIERLTRVQRGALPAVLTHRIRAWAKHYGDAALEEVALLQVRDEQTLNELLADPKVAPLLKRFTPNANKALARIHPDDIETLRALLAERGVDISNKIK